MKNTLLLCLFFGFSYCQAQDLSPFKARNTVYLELLGSGGVYSVNYERLFSVKTNRAYGFRVGPNFYSNMPAGLIGELFTIVGAGSHHGDFGIGLRGMYGRDSEGPYFTSKRAYLSAVPRLSYRYQKPTGGLMLRAGFTPFIKISEASETKAFRSWFGLSVGYSF
jgi:hypothetical protein